VDLSYFVFHPWTAARPSVNADQLLAASMSGVVFLNTDAQISLVQFQTRVGNHDGTHGGVIMMVVRWLCGSQSGYEGH
jgi:hypothetical protein